MRRQTPIAHLLYNYLYPNPTTNDPPSFSAHLARNLVPEVRIEVATFYGDLNSTEARYPGLNYCHPPHRLRLGRFKHHKRLFDAFDNLGLTYGEVQDFCCWEGTKWARERYEKDEGIKVPDTTGDEIGPYVDRRHRSETSPTRRQSITRKTDIMVMVEQAPSSHPIPEAHDEEMSDAGSDGTIEEEMDDHDDDTTETAPETEAEALARQHHVEELLRRREQGIHQRLIEAWERGEPLPPALEQYLKDQSERGTLGNDLSGYYNDLRPSRRSSTRYTTEEAASRPAAAAVIPRAAA